VHEDDPERAVRAGLRLIEDLEGLTRPDGTPLEVRVGVNTGDALVRLDVDPASGRGFLTGDAVNTAARLQGVAPPMAVAVGEATHVATERTFRFDACHPVALKGKAEPVHAWIAVEPLARTGSESRRARPGSRCSCWPRPAPRSSSSWVQALAMWRPPRRSESARSPARRRPSSHATASAPSRCPPSCTP